MAGADVGSGFTDQKTLNPWQQNMRHSAKRKCRRQAITSQRSTIYSGPTSDSEVNSKTNTGPRRNRVPIGAENTAGFQTSFTPFLFNRTGTISIQKTTAQTAG